MRIALISYEFPPDTADGGIATYAAQAARMLLERGHDVEVFAASRLRASSGLVGGVRVHRVLEPNTNRFAETIAPLFAARHEEREFDVLEGPEYKADARVAIRLVPDIPLVVKLHTPGFMIQRIEAMQERVLLRWRKSIAMSLKGLLPPWHPMHEKHNRERMHVLAADEVAAPSQTIAKLVIKAWGVDAQRVSCFPLPFTPSAELLGIPSETATRKVTFLGRLEVRKGVLDLAAAIPLVLRYHPEVTFRFVGRPLYYAGKGVQMDAYLRELLGPFMKSVRLEAAVPPNEIAAVLATSDICVFPSHWESFGLVCLESLAAARGVVCTAGSGLEELVGGGEYGLLAPPRSPEKLAQAIGRLLDDPPLRMRLGNAGRRHVLEAYNDNSIGAQQEASYRRAIERKRHGLPSRRHQLAEAKV